MNDTTIMSNLVLESCKLLSPELYLPPFLPTSSKLYNHCMLRFPSLQDNNFISLFSFTASSQPEDQSLRDASSGSSWQVTTAYFYYSYHKLHYEIFQNDLCSLVQLKNPLQLRIKWKRLQNISKYNFQSSGKLLHYLHLYNKGNRIAHASYKTN